MPERKLSPLYSVLVALVIVLGLGFFALSFYRLDYEWDFRALGAFFWEDGSPGLILRGLWGTLYISAISIGIGSILGTGLGLVLVGREPVSRWAALAYVDVFRNTPVLVQLYIAYFVVGSAFSLSAEQAGILTLSLFCAAYVSDIVRGTLVNFERGQTDAAKSLGMTPWQVAWHVVLPQALRRMLPPLVGQFVTLVKDSSLVSVLGIVDLTKSALNVVSVTFRGFETWFVIAAIYLAVNLVVSSLGRYLEHRLSLSLRA